jgi:hypothetical protein
MKEAVNLDKVEAVALEHIICKKRYIGSSWRNRLTRNYSNRGMVYLVGAETTCPWRKCSDPSKICFVHWSFGYQLLASTEKT